MARALWLSARFLAFYAVFLALVAWTPVGPAAGRLVAAGAATVLELCTERPVEGSVVADRLSLRAMPSGTHPGAAVELSLLPHVRNVPMFLAILAALARRRLGMGLWIAFAGVAAILALDAIVVASVAWKKLLPLRIGFRVTSAYELLAVFRVFHVTGAGLSAVPVFLGAAAAWFLLGEPEEPDA